MSDGRAEHIRRVNASLTPEQLAKKRETALANMKKAHAASIRSREIKYEKLAQFVAMNPFCSVKQACQAVGLTSGPAARKQVANVLAQPAMLEKIQAYKQDFVSPLVMADIGERYRTLALQAVDKAQDRLNAKDCKDNTLVEILRVCSQYLAPKNAAVQINAGQVVGILSDLQSSAQEQLQKLPEKVIGPD